MQKHATLSALDSSSAGLHSLHAAPAALPAGADGAHWPVRRRVLGVPISCTTYDEVVSGIMAAGRHRIPTLVTAFAVHGVVTAAEDTGFRRQIEDFHVVTPDGQ